MGFPARSFAAEVVASRMLSGTLAALGYPLRGQVLVSSSRALTTQDLNKRIVVDSTGGAVILTLPDGVSINAGGFFQIVAPTADIGMVTIVLPGGNTFNLGQPGPLLLSTINAAVTVVADQGSTWTATFGTAPVAAPPSGAGNTFVFRPGGAASGNVFTDWSLLIAAHALVEGPTIIELDDRLGPIIIPAGGPYDMRDTTIQGRLLSGTPVVATISPGATFTNLEVLRWTRFSYSHTSPAMVVPPGLSYFRMWGASIQNGGTAPFFDVTTAGAFLLTQFENASGFNPLPLPPPTPVVELGSGNFFSFSFDEACSNGVDTVSGPGDASITVAIRDDSATFEPITAPTFLGTVSTTFLSRGSTLVYRPGEPVPSGNVFASWTALVNYLASGPGGPKIVEIDDSLVSPAVIDASADLTNVTLVGRIRGTSTFCDIAPGVVLTGLSRTYGPLALNNTGPTAAIVMAPGEVLLIEEGTALTASPAGPLISIPGPGAPAVIRAETGAGLSGPNPVVSVGATGTFLFQAFENALNTPGTIAGAAGATGIIVVVASSAAFHDPSGDAVWLSGAFIIVISEKSSLTTFAAAVAAQWAAPAPTIQEDATNRLAAAVFGIIGPIP